jgi:radical SAM superfamily enzyme with C-terminal helix-hairpin-helix motif
MQAIRLINEVGGKRGTNGLPKMLPGLNFVIGLDGESQSTLPMNLEFLRQVLREGLLLRRINIRQVSSIRREFHPKVDHGRFLKFKETVRKEIDHELLRRMVPQGTVLKDIFTEIKMGKVSFGRQIGTYPLLVGFEHPVHLNKFIDAKVVEWGQRSITAVQYPLDINHCHISAIEALPGIGRKRAMRIFRSVPFEGPDDFISAMDDPALAHMLLDYLRFDRT